MRSRLPALLTALVVALGSLTTLTLVSAAPASAAATIYNVPTPDAGLGRIVASPTGDLWFVEKEAQKIGRITPQGIVSEIDLSLDSDFAQVKDLDVAPDGTLWVIIDSGEYAVHLSADGSKVISVPPIGASDSCVGNSCPYGEQVRVAPDGRAWVTMSYDEQFASIVTDAGRTDVPNAPPCQGPLGEAADGSMWCTNNGSMFHLPGNAGVPVGVFNSWPVAMTAGPVGDIWFADQASGTFTTSPSAGFVGYLSGVNPVRFNTGARTAPNDLVRGPDNQMWFTSVGAAKGIGHVDATGRGALTQVGGYEPESLTFGTDGAVWFTDATNNVIVRVPTSDLQVTNVDPGAGSVFSITPPAPPLAGGGVVVQAGKKPITISKGKVRLTLACPTSATAGCAGSIQLTTAKKVRKPGKKKGKKAYAAVTKATAFSIPAGAATKVKLKVTGKGARQLKRRGATTLLAQVGGTPVAKLKVKR